MKKLLLLFIASFIFCSPDIVIGQNSDTYQALKNAFLNPPAEARPKVYWWCLNGNIDTIRARQEFKAMKEAGISGFDLFEIGNLPEDTMISAGPAFLSDKSLKTIKFVVDEAGKLGLTVGLNLASSWNAGGSWIEPKYGGKSLYYSKLELTGTDEKKSFKLPFPEISFPKKSWVGGGTYKPLIPFQENGRPVYYEEVAVLAIPAGNKPNSLDTTAIIDVTPFFDPETDMLLWKAPSGSWNICRYVCSSSGQQLVLPSPLSAGLTIDHFDSTAVAFHFNYIIKRLLPVLGDFRKTALKSFYLASYEARGFVWTSSLSTEFKKVNGYNIRKFIPSLFDPKLFKPEITQQVQADFRKTLSELMINNLYRKSKQICNNYGLKINSEAGGPGFPLFNGPAEPLKAQGALDTPRGEFWINFSKTYIDISGKDSVDLMRVVKETAAASHIYGKGIVEEEAFTSFQHWQEGPSDMKPLGDRAFCDGMNKVVFHGFSHNISNSGFPGYVYHAGTHFNDKRVWWQKVKPFVDYLARISALFQNADFKADVLWYYGDQVPNSGRPKNTHFKAGPGFDYEIINSDILLNNLSGEKGELALTNGGEFELLALEDEKKLNPDVAKKLNELEKQGVAILRSQGTPYQMLQSLGVLPDINYLGIEHQLLDFIHFSREDVDFYFIRNTQNEWISRNVSFRQKNKTPEIWNPVSGEIAPVAIFNPQGEYITLPVTLVPYGSCLVVFRQSSLQPLYTEILGSGSNPPLLEFNANGISILQEGNFCLKGSSRFITLNNNVQTSTLDGSWEVSFTKGWGAPETIIFPKLISWTESDIEGIKYYSGTATYRKDFRFNLNPGTKGKEKIYLDLGEISKVGDVWLNGKHLGITWTKPYCFDVTNVIKQGNNAITVEIANVWANRLIGDAITGQKFTNTNITSTFIPSPVFKPGNQKYIPWAKVPLIESGLLGPVTIKTIIPLTVKKYE